MNKMNWKRTLVCAAALVGATVLLGAQTWAGKPAPPTPPQPPIHYRIHYFTPADDGARFNAIKDMNESGVMVGNYYIMGTPGTWFGFIYDPLIDLDHAIDLNNLVEVPDGWRITDANSINDSGAILVSVEKILHPSSTDPDYEKRGLLVNTTTTDPNSGKWTATWIPVVPPIWNPDETPKRCYGWDINNNGDLVGVYSDGSQNGAFIYSTGLYDGLAPSEPVVLPFTLYNLSVKINDPLPNRPSQVVGNAKGVEGSSVFRYTLGVPGLLETFPQLASPSGLNPPSVQGINGYGEFCGSFIPSRKVMWMPFRYAPPLQASPEALGYNTAGAGGSGMDINDSRDVAIHHPSGNPFLFHNEKGMLNLDNLVVGLDADVANWLASGWRMHSLTERDAIGGTTDFPCIATSNFYFGCLLVPELVK